MRYLIFIVFFLSINVQGNENLVKNLSYIAEISNKTWNKNFNNYCQVTEEAENLAKEYYDIKLIHVLLEYKSNNKKHSMACLENLNLCINNFKINNTYVIDKKTLLKHFNILALNKNCATLTIIYF